MIEYYKSGFLGYGSVSSSGHFGADDDNYGKNDTKDETEEKEDAD